MPAKTMSRRAVDRDPAGTLAAGAKKLWARALADAAAVAGYAGQAHLARETKRIAGVTMTKLLAWPGPQSRQTL